MIYLTHTHAVCTTHCEMLSDLKYPQKVHWFPESYARVKSGLVYPPHVIMQRALDAARGTGATDAIYAKPAKTAFIFASGSSTLAGATRTHKPTCLSYDYKFLPLTLTNIYAGRTAQQFGQVDLVQTDASACASSLKVLMDVCTLIQQYGFERVVVLTGEDQVSNSSLDFFGETGASLAPDDRRLPSAFDGTNGGFHVGQGAALAVFETDTALSGTPLARLVSAYAASEQSTNAIGQLESGEGFIKAITGALSYGGVPYRKVSVVKTHGTGTASNNVAERNALKATLPSFVATSYKPTIGHTMGASGLLESLLLIHSLRDGKVPAIANRTELDEVFLSQDSPAPDHGYLLSVAAGMGNIYAAAVFDWRV